MVELSNCTEARAIVEVKCKAATDRKMKQLGFAIVHLSNYYVTYILPISLIGSLQIGHSGDISFILRPQL